MYFCLYIFYYFYFENNWLEVISLNVSNQEFVIYIQCYPTEISILMWLLGHNVLFFLHGAEHFLGV